VRRRSLVLGDRGYLKVKMQEVLDVGKSMGIGFVEGLGASGWSRNSYFILD